jgi:hypothetical protein
MVPYSAGGLRVYWCNTKTGAATANPARRALIRSYILQSRTINKLHSLRSTMAGANNLRILGVQLAFASCSSGILG